MGKIGKTPKKVNLKPDLQYKIPHFGPRLIYPWGREGWCGFHVISAFIMVQEINFTYRHYFYNFPNLIPK